jgi:predicted Zn-ribbon and HTH transcriptional regulator
MYRKGLIGLLQDHPASVRELSRSLGMSPTDVEDDLRHLLKSLHHMPYRAVIAPAVCKKCGFAFSRDKLRKPGRCPQCHSSWISAPLIGIEATQ